MRRLGFPAQNAKAPFIQMMDPEYTVMVKIEKSKVPGTGRIS